MSSRVVLIGAGPGDVDLLTLKGKEYISKADCIIYDRLASKDILNFAKKECEFIFVGKENHHHVMKQDEINELLVKKASEHNLVVRLKGGDPYVFGRGGEEALKLQENGIEVEVLSGVTSAISVLAAAGIPITHRGIAKGFQVITAHSKKDQPSDIDFTQLLDETVTLVFLMGLAHVGEIAKGLMDAGRCGDTPAAVISKGTTVNQRKCVGTLENIAELVIKAELESPSIIVVGEVVSLQDKLSFFESRPLFGRKILVPYIEGFKYTLAEGIISFTENRLAAMLRDKGAQVESFKIGKIVPRKLTEIEQIIACNWIVFTSANGVYSFMHSLFEQGKDIRALANCKIAVIGKKTAEVLKEFSLTADFIPQLQTAEGLASELKKLVSKSDVIAYLSAKEVDSNIEELLEDCCEIKRIVAYENRRVEVEAINTDNEYVCFTSASSVHRTMEAVGKMDITAISIGPSCSKALRKEGIENYTEASEPSYEGIVMKLMKQ